MDAFRINVLKLHMAGLINDNKTNASHETPEEIAGTMQIQITPKVASGTLYGDGKIRDATDKIIGYNITLDHNKVPPNLIAKMKGQRKHDKMRRSNSADQGQYFALGWEVELTGDHKELTWLPKCKLAPSNKNLQQTTDNTNYSTDSFTITAIPLDYNGDFEYIADTSDEELEFTLDDAANWFKEVPVAPPLGSTVPALPETP